MSVLNEIEYVMQEHDASLPYEVITVVDGSPDGVYGILAEAAKTRPNLCVVKLSMNFGQTSARMAGYRYASGNIVVTLDDDGQCPIAEVWQLIEPLYQGADASIAYFPKKRQSRFKNFGSKVNSFMSHAIVGIPKSIHISSFVAFNQFVRMELVKHDNPNPYFSGLLFQITDKVANVPLEQRPRISGESTYSFRKLVSVWLNGFTSFSVKPLRVADIIGIACALFGFIFGIYTVVIRLLNVNIMPGYSTIAASIFFVGGILMILLGIVGEYVGRTLIILNNAPQYVVREIVPNMYFENSN